MAVYNQLSPIKTKEASTDYRQQPEFYRFRINYFRFTIITLIFNYHAQRNSLRFHVYAIKIMKPEEAIVILCFAVSSEYYDIT